MTSDKPKDIKAILTDRKVVEAAMRKAELAAIRQHQMAGVPLVMWENGKVVMIPAEELLRLRSQQFPDDPQYK